MLHSGRQPIHGVTRARGGAWVAILAVVAALLVGSPATAAVMTDETTGATGAPLAASAQGPDQRTADLSKFQAGNIISDAVFFDSGTMTSSQIQAFLESQVPTCREGYTCLKDWYDTSRSVAADAMCGAYSGGQRERASQIIFKVAKACGINPQVILATLQKEQGLVTHVWPSDWRYTIAMGQGCPDTAACDERYHGFFNQVYGAAWQFKRYANPPGTSQFFTWYAPKKTWDILYHPNRDCGTSPVYVSNQATANLYYYTPYQPNQAALSAGYGQGNGCSAYGNRNFYQYFTDWFGSTQASSPCAVPSDIDSAHRTYVATERITAREAPNTKCTSGSRTLEAGAVVQALAVTADRAWLKVHMEDVDLWIPRDSVRYTATGESACAMPDARSAYKTYVVTGEGVVGRIAPSAGCDDSVVDVTVGAVATAVAVTADKDWIKLAFADGHRWVPRDQVRYASGAEKTCALPTDFRAAYKSYVVLPGGSTARSAPSIDCDSEVTPMPAGAQLTATGVTADKAWLMFEDADGRDLWLPRTDVDYASRVDVCDLGTVTRSAYKTYVVTGEGVVGRIAPSAGCDDSVVDVTVGAVATAVAVTADKDWIKLAFADGHRWVPRDQVRYASGAEKTCALPTDFRAAYKSYVVLSGGSTARSAPSIDCESEVTPMPAGAQLTATGVTADKAWLMFEDADGRDLWLPRTDVDYE